MTPEQQAAIREAVLNAIRDAFCTDDNYPWFGEAADAAIAAHLKALEVAGLCVVPLEPTIKMVAEANRLNHPRDRDVYLTMLAARPR